MNDGFNPLTKGETLSLESQFIGRQLHLASNNFADLQIKGEQLIEVIKRKLDRSDNQGNKLFDQGVNCEALRFGAKGWQKGRLRARVILEFCLDEPEVEEMLTINDQSLS